MSQQPSDPPPLPPTPLQYQSPLPGKPQDNRNGGQFMLGLVLGGAVSGIVWGFGWKVATASAAGPWALLLVPGVKVVVGVVLLSLPRWRSFGAGLLTSIALGMLIFFVRCTANL